MINWHTVKAKFTKEFTDGTLKRVTDTFLVSAMSFTEAEARIHKEVGAYVRGEFQVSSIAKTDLQDIFEYDDSDTYFKAKTSYISEDADTGKEKKVNYHYLVSAKDIKEAYERIEDSLKGLMITFEIPQIVKTNIIEIFAYDPEFASTIQEETESPNINVAYAHNEEQ